MSDAIGAGDLLAAVAGAHARRFDDELVILDLEGGDYFALNAVGAVIWEGFVSGHTPAQVALEITSAYSVDPERALNDCLRLANELLERHLLRKA